MSDPTRILFPTHDFDLSATLNSGQAFRWHANDDGWEGVIDRHWVSLRVVPAGIEAHTATPQTDWTWLRHYLQIDVDLTRVLAAFPADATMHAAVTACRGLRLLRQSPWECLASFICSASKQIVQIRQILGQLCARFGEPVVGPADQPPAFAFPGPHRIAALTETELRACKMGFRAPHLFETARRVAAGEIDLTRLESLNTAAARGELMQLPGVGPKIADCVLLFAYGRQDAFPRDVWISRALRELYFGGRRVTPTRLREFSGEHFGPFAGYAQQYLFHYIRVHKRRPTRQDARPT